MIISSTNQSLLICNIALSYIGLNFITSFEENNKESALCKFWYKLSKIEVLSSYPFKVTIRELSLHPLTDSSLKSNLGNLYTYCYMLPENCLDVISVNGTNNYYNDHEILGCNFSPIVLRYIHNLENKKIPLYIAKLISLKLACNIAIALHSEARIVNYLSQKYDIEFKRSTNLDSQKGNIRGIVEDQEEETTWIASRR